MEGSQERRLEKGTNLILERKANGTERRVSYVLLYTSNGKLKLLLRRRYTRGSIYERSTILLHRSREECIISN